MLSLAVGKWLVVLEVNLLASQVASHIIRVQEDANAVETIQDIVDDVFAAKVETTLNARSTAVFLYVKWHSSKVIAAVPSLPIDEEHLYVYFTHLRKQRAPATRAASLLQAWSFCVHVLGFTDPTLAESSLRCKGSAHRQFMTKKPAQQKGSAVHDVDLDHRSCCVF